MSKHFADVLIAPKLSEKSNDAMIELNQYTFEITAGSTKPDVRRAISEKYGVTVVDVNLINLPRKIKRAGRFEYQTAKRRKAIITLAAGERIADLTEAI